MAYVNWPDKELRPVADSVSFGTDKIGSDIQRNRKKSVPDAYIWTRSLKYIYHALNGFRRGERTNIE